MWITATHASYKVKKLEKVQRLALLMISGATGTTPTARLEAIVGLVPIDIHLKGQAMRAWRRLFRTDSICFANLNGLGHIKWVRENIGLVPSSTIPPSLSDLCPRVDINNKKYSCTHASRTEWETGAVKVKHRGVECFSDGSLITNNITADHSSGCGVVIMRYNPKRVIAAQFYLGKLATVYDCELEGIRRTALKLVSLNITGQEITIYSDNLSCILALSRNSTKSRLVTATHNSLQAAGRSNRLTLEWIPGHRGYYGNETADRFAKRGCSHFYPAPEPLLPVRESVINSEIRKWMNDMWQRRWKSSTQYTQTKFWVPRPRIMNNAPAVHLSRQMLRSLTGIITGHIAVRKHLHNLGVYPSPLCDCGEVESVIHILTDCPLHIMIRLLHLRQAIVKEPEVQFLGYKCVLSFFMAVGTVAKEQQQSATSTV